MWGTRITASARCARHAAPRPAYRRRRRRRPEQRAHEAAERIEAGHTWINSRSKVYDELPFGGRRSSGYGKKHGEEAFDYYTETKSVVFGGSG
ncbi:MAG TPA: aldehyde dehydrogenase family protein [Solirubrobacteraceae bacterium]|jgi:acyl-CoA reductase-like NAD-dependent aldehyde dehydrogenase|nr:aldehyde dehydrogenase family protein [Solirubrobacteraceae bacterium]